MKLSLILTLFYAFNLWSIQVIPGSPQTEKRGIGYRNIVDAEEIAQKTFLKQGNIVFDVGANVGMWSLRALKAQQKIRIYAFEPSPKNYEALQKNLKHKDASLYQLALDQCSQERVFQAYDIAPKWNKHSGFWDRGVFKQTYRGAPTKIRVQTKAIDEFCSENNLHRIDYLKIDTEGAEFSIIQGADEMISSSRVPIIQFEYGGCFIDAECRLEDVYGYLKEKGYELFRLSDKGLVHICSWSGIFESFRWCNYIAIEKTHLAKHNLSCCWD